MSGSSRALRQGLVPLLAWIFFAALPAPPATSADDEIVPSVHANDSLLQSQSFAGASAPTAFGGEARTIDGSGNNVANPTWGAAGTNLLRLTAVEYGDSISTPAGASRPNARVISNALSAQTASAPSGGRESDFAWQWGQFVDHDIDLAEIADPEEPFDIPVPLGDPYLDPAGTGTQQIELDRTAWDPATGTSGANPRQQPNFVTAFIDASNVYGSDAVRAAALRLLDGSGKLETSAGDLPPFNDEGLPNAGGFSSLLFLAGDIRANEQLALTSMHTLFIREHNRLCDKMIADDPTLSGEELYQRARAIVGAEMQVITYKEFLPVLLGPNALSSYGGYDPQVNPGIANIFATAGYRMGHSMLPEELMRLDRFGDPIPQGNVRLKNAFFEPDKLINEGGIDPLLRGLAFQTTQEIDLLVIDAVRNFLFGHGAAGLDLAALNIQRGRDHGLPDYNQARVDYGLAPVTSFAEIGSDPAVHVALASLYPSVDDVDAWVGGLAEDPMPGAMVGELVGAILVDQFERLRDGDRFWYQNVFSGDLLAEIESTRLGGVIRRNTSIGEELQSNVFYSTQLPAIQELPSVSRPGMAVLALVILAGGALLLETRRPRRA
jgi:peroxidase